MQIENDDLTSMDFACLTFTILFNMLLKVEQYTTKGGGDYQKGQTSVLCENQNLSILFREHSF